MARRTTVLERHEIGGTGGRELPNPPTIIERDTVQTGGKGGGQGGTVVLIVGTLFLGYLYFTGRIQGVIEAIKNPGNLSGKTTGSIGLPPLNPNQNPYSTVPISPQSSGYPRRFMITFPPQYNAQPIEISAADKQSCQALVYSGTYLATGSFILAATYAQQYC